MSLHTGRIEVMTEEGGFDVALGSFAELSDTSGNVLFYEWDSLPEYQAAQLSELVERSQKHFRWVEDQIRMILAGVEEEEAA